MSTGCVQWGDIPGLDAAICGGGDNSATTQHGSSPYRPLVANHVLWCTQTQPFEPRCLTGHTRHACARECVCTWMGTEASAMFTSLKLPSSNPAIKRGPHTGVALVQMPAAGCRVRSNLHSPPLWDAQCCHTHMEPSSPADTSRPTNNGHSTACDDMTLPPTAMQPCVRTVHHSEGSNRLGVGTQA